MNYVHIILKAAKTAKISGVFLLAICTHETKLTNIQVLNDGGSTSYGICQVKYDTAKMLGYDGKPEGLMVPSVNAKWAAEYLKYQYDRYGGVWYRAVAAYNAGQYNESTKINGCPRNLKYVKKVQEKMPIHFREQLTCNPAKNVEDQ
jgi:soluble lytic murein transglycosylase-like protein